MNRPAYLLVFLLSITPAYANPDGDEDTTRNFDIPGSEQSEFSAPFQVDDANTALNPLQKLAANWPEDLVIAPVPAYSPQLGWNLTLAGAYFLNTGNQNPDVSPSTLAGFVMAAENGSYVYGGGTYLHLLDDKLRVKAGALYADVRYRYYGIGDANDIVNFNVDVLQNGPVYFLGGRWNIWKRLYVGLGYQGGNIDTRFRIEVAPPFAFDPVLSLDLGALTIPIEVDTRDHDKFPRDGWLVTGQAALYRESAGSDFEGETYKLGVNRYFPVREFDVLATRLVIKSTSDDVPFFLLAQFGGTTDLRGYPSGRYRDQKMYALQTEYRWQFNERWIFTGFLGVGEVATSFSDMGDDFLPAGGVGARYVLSRKHKVGLSLDLATGRDGTEFYFGVGEAF